MKKSPTYQRYVAVDHGLDPELDFSKFLEEARKHTSEENFEAAPQNPEEDGEEQWNEAKKKRKSWKSSLFSWWKADKRSNFSIIEASISSDRSKPRHGPVSTSGLMIKRSGGGGGDQPRCSKSGPLASFFRPVKREKTYMCLEKLNGDRGVQPYGPIYLVS